MWAPTVSHLLFVCNLMYLFLAVRYRVYLTSDILITIRGHHGFNQSPVADALQVQELSGHYAPAGTNTT